MTWNYRVLIHPPDKGLIDDADYYAIHEVYYEKDGITPKGFTSEPVSFGAESLDELRKALVTALADTFRNPPLRVTGFGLEEVE